jgi:predicted glycogen debranching enzyme
MSLPDEFELARETARLNLELTRGNSRLDLELTGSEDAELAQEGARFGQLEWLESNLLGSFCFACVDRKLRRKYHALLIVRDPGRGDAWNLLAETRESLSLGAESFVLADPLTEERDQALVGFSAYPHATHRYRVSLFSPRASTGRGPAPSDAVIDIERSVRLGARDQVEIRYRVRNVPEQTGAPLRLTIEPLLRCRPLHQLTQENPFLDGTCVKLGDEVRMLPYAGMPAIALRVYGAHASFEEQGMWLPAPAYAWEAARGYAASESLFSPGRFTITLSHDTELTFVVGLHRVEAPVAASVEATARREQSASTRTQAEFGSTGRSEVLLARGPARFDSAVNVITTEPLARAAAQFFACSANHQSAIIAGYPWLSVQSHAALSALPGVYLATGSWQNAEQVLSYLAASRVHGLIAKSPAFAGRQADEPSVEASLLFASTVQWFKAELGEERVASFMPVVCELLEAIAEGADPRVRFDRGIGIYSEPGPYALTWMDAMIDGQPVTPRAGYAVDLDALAYNALHFACAWADDKRPGFARTFRNRMRNAEGEFVRRYWDDARGYLADAHDGQRADSRLRPNQLWALALPHRPISNAMAHAALHAVTRDLWTPLGLRTLSPQDPDYRGHYGGDQTTRDRAHHQGSVFPWLTGIYADAMLLTLGRAALIQQLAPILLRINEHIESEACLGQVSELFDGAAPHQAGGAPASVLGAAELYRAQRLFEDVADSAQTRSRAEPRASTSAKAPQKQPPFSNQHNRETLSK